MLQHFASQIIQAGLRNFANRVIKRLIGRTYFVYVTTLQQKKLEKIDVVKTFQIV